MTSHPSIQKVGHFPIRMPTLDGVKPGEKVNMTIRMYFGLTEIKIECIIKDKVIVFTSAFEASDGSGGGQDVAAGGYVQDGYGAPPPAIGVDPYGTPAMNASQASFGAYPPNGAYGSGPPPQQQQPAYSQQGGYPPATYGGYPPAATGAAYPAEDNYYQQPYADPQGYPPQQQQQQQQQAYYGAGGGYPPTSQGYPQQGGYPSYQ